tara:strand:+ start:39 stop:2654 length:2616 start_codon:yes stop_codon:yes gene_type:complete
MASIDDAIKTLIKELQKVSGKSAAGSPTGAARPTTEESEDVRRIQGEINDLYDERLSKESQSIKNAKAAVNAADKNLATFKKELATKKELNEADEQRLRTLTEIVRQQDEFLQLAREAEDAASSLADSFAGIFSGAGGVSMEKMLNPKAILGAAENMSKMLRAGVGFSEMSKQAVFAFTGAILKTSMALADGEAKFMKATGASKDFARSVTESYETTREFGATMEETSAAYQTLFTTFTDFTMLSKNQRKSIAETSTLMAKLGISNEDFAKSIQISTKAMGMSSAQAGQNMEDLAGFAQQLGVAPQQLAADFAGAGDMLAKMGQDGTKAFKDLAIVAKTTGMKMESILAITNKFDTFEGAAGQAGKLNAALGGNFVNAMDLMMATNPAERFGMIRDSILDAGLSFDEMSYYQKNFYKDSLGLSDVGELAALMSGDMDLVTGATEQTGKQLIDTRNRAHEMATMQENLNTVLANMIPIITPLIDLMKDITEGMAKNADVAKKLGYGLIAVAGAYLLIQGALKAAKVATVAYNFVMGVANLIGLTRLGGLMASIKAKYAEAIATKFQKKAQDNLNKSGAKGSKISANTVKTMLSIGAASLMLGVGIGLAAYGTAQLALAFKDLGDAAPWAAAGIGLLMIPFVAFFAAAAFIVFSGVGPGIAGVFLAMGAAALLLGAGIAIAGLGMSFLVKSFAGFEVEQLFAMAAAMLAFSASMYVFAVAAMMVGNPLAIAGIIALTAGLLGMAFALTLIEELIVNVASAFESFFGAIANPQTADNIKQISDAIQAIPVRKNIEFAASMSALAAANTAAAVAGTVNAVASTITGQDTTQQNKSNLSKQPQQITVNLMLDKVKLATIVKEINGESAKDAIAGRG